VKKLKLAPENFFFTQIYVILSGVSKQTNKLRISLSVADFANHVKFVFSWPVWTVYGFATATKRSKSHRHQPLLLYLFTSLIMVLLRALVPTRNSSTYLYVAQLCDADLLRITDCAVATALKLFFNFGAVVPAP